MKKRIAVITAIVVLTVTGLALAQMNDQGKGMMGQGMMDKGMMEGKGMMMHSMMNTMMNKSMVATSDGGVIVMTANKLTKYDKDLNVVKEVDIKMDMDGMQKMMTEMMEKCPMMGKGMMGKGMMGTREQAGAKAPESAAAASPEVDHASHH